MTDTQSRHTRAEVTTSPESKPDSDRRFTRKLAMIIGAIAIAVLLVVVVVALAVTDESNGGVQTSGFPGQGGVGSALATDGAEPERRDDGPVGNPTLWWTAEFSPNQ